MRVDQRFAAACALAAAFLPGCGDSGPPLVPVSGKVTVNSKPVENVEVIFVPDPSNKDVTSGHAYTGPDGSYNPRVNGRFGLALGRYKVIFKKTNDPEPGTVIPKGFENDPTQQAFLGLRKQALPRKFADPFTSNEQVEVKPEGDNVFEFDLKFSEKQAKSEKKAK